MTISEKVANLKGIIEGMELDTSKGEGKLIAKITEILDDIALELEDLNTQTENLHDYCDELDSDLGDVEEYLLDEAEADDEYDDDLEDDYDEDDYEDEDEDVIEAICPECGEEIDFLTSEDPSDIICPSCGKHVSFICEGECDGCTGCDDPDQ